MRIGGGNGYCCCCVCAGGEEIMDAGTMVRVVGTYAYPQQPVESVERCTDVLSLVINWRTRFLCGDV